MAQSSSLSRGGSGTNMSILQQYLSLPQNGKVQCEYIWIGGSGNDLRSKTRTMNSPIKSLSDLPNWNFDGSSTGQAEGHYSEVWIRPVKMVKDPFRQGDNLLVLCECLDAKTMEPHITNNRAPANKIFEDKRVSSEITWFGIEQEYTMFESDGITVLGWPKQGYPAPQGPYYCGVGNNKAIGRHIVESHYRACLYAGLDISGINAEVMPGQWEFQIGPCIGIDSGDQLWLARYILERVAEDFGVGISLSPKPVKGDWNGTGAHTNYSTLSMRTDPKSIAKTKSNNNSNNQNHKYGMDSILSAIGKLAVKHKEHMNVYGKGNELRLLGSHETAKYDEFSYGVANRGASVRIPRQSDKDGYGYLEDRRPAANCDPYNVTSIIAQTTLM